MRFPLAALFVGLYALPALGADGDPSTAYSPSLHDPHTVLVAKKGKHKKKEEDDFGPPEIQAATDNDNGIGIHREQIGVDTPYKAEAGGAGDISFLNHKTGAADPLSSTNVGINVRILFIVGHAAVGGEVGLLYEGGKTPVTVTNGATTSTTSVSSSTTGVSLVPMFKWNFTDINHSLTVPFVYVGAGYQLQQSKAGDAAAQKATGPIAKVGVGLNLFLTGFAAINPAIEYRLSNLKPDKGDQTSESGVHVLGGFTLFL